jgi:long-chain acyl-CoA synthetase
MALDGAAFNFQAGAESLPRLCLEAIRRHAKRDALNAKQGKQWHNLDAETFLRRVRQVAMGLRSLGIRAGDRVAMLSENRPEWPITDLAILSLGAVNVPIYTTQAVEQVRYILNDSGARVLFISGKRVHRHARRGLEGVETIEKTIFFDPEAVSLVPGALTLDELERRGEQQERDEPGVFEECVEKVRGEDLATIIYTSGTTGEPKGVMLSHSNFVSNIQAISRTLPIYPTDVALSVLPLSHIFERGCFYVFCNCGVSVYFAASFDQVGEFLREVRPTVMTAVPRLFEKVYQKIVATGAKAGGWKSKIFNWSLGIGQEYGQALDERQALPLGLKMKHALADRLVYSKWRAGVGGRLRYFVSGGAAMSPTLAHTFNAAGITILQGYGMTETAIVCANRPDDNKVGSIGRLFPGIEAKFAEDGEILLRGPNIMQGYYGHPEATAEAIKDGWFATGDVGHLDKHGHLYITDRKKDLFKLSNGKYVAPQLVESLLKQSAFVGQAVVIGAGRKTTAALIVPEWDALAAALREKGENAPDTRPELSRHPAAVKIVQEQVSLLTAGLSDYERVRKVALIPDEFTVDGGELTPTLKVKRRVVEERYRTLIEELYGGKSDE